MPVKMAVRGLVLALAMAAAVGRSCLAMVVPWEGGGAVMRVAVVVPWCRVVVAGVVPRASRVSQVSSELESGVDETAAALTARYGTAVEEVTKGWLWNSRETVGFDVAPRLHALLQGLYRLRRSAVTRFLGDADSSEQLRLLLLTAPHAAASVAVSPRLHAAQLSAGALLLSELPPIDLAMRPSALLLLDAHTELYVWRGAAVPDYGAVEALEAKAHAIALSRVPSASVLSIAEGAPLERCLLCRLEPSRLDPPDVHAASATAGAAAGALTPTLSPEARQQLLARLGPTDEASFWGWGRERGVRNPFPSRALTP